MGLKQRLEETYDSLERFASSTGLGVSFPVFVLTLFVMALVAGTLLVAVLDFGPLLSFLAFLSILSLIVGIPLAIRGARIDEIEQNLPDALKHMSIVLTAGGTIVSALEEAAEADYGPLSADLRQALHQLREGRTFDEVLLDASRNSGSVLFQRVAFIIVDAKRSGAGLSEVMTAIAEDTRDVLHIKRERRSRTTMHVAFLLLSSLFLSPFIFGFTLSIVGFISEGMAQALGQIGQLQAGGEAVRLSFAELNALLVTFIGVQVVLTAFAVGVIREGKMLKYFVYIPFMLLLALAVFEGGKWVSNALVGVV